ncbi:MAG: hypothetical protein LBQ27_01555, partial [Clostridiales bacterium]|nr:hypothetical protein [Clostridiales bacterium]
DDNSYIYAYGSLPMMNFKHCPNKTFGIKCGDCKEKTIIGDRKYNYDIIRTKLRACYHTLYNPVTINLSKHRPDFNIYLNMLNRGALEISDIIFAFKNGQICSDGVSVYTAGHYSRGVF